MVSGIKSLFNILLPAIEALSDDQLRQLQGAVLHIGPLIAAEQDKRDGNITNYSIEIVGEEGIMKLKIEVPNAF